MCAATSCTAFLTAHPGDHRPHALHRVLPPRGDRAHLRRLLLRCGVLGDQGGIEHHRRGPAVLPLQDRHPGRRRVRPHAGDRGDHPLRHLPEAGRLALARGGRRGSGRREAEGRAAREGRGHPEAGRVRGPQRAGEVKLRKGLWFGFSLMALMIVAVLAFMPWGNLIDGHLSKQDLGFLGLLMLALIVVAIMLGFPTAFTLMGMGVFFAWLAYRSVNPALAGQQVLDLFVLRTFGVMSNDVLIAIPLFLFRGYLVERAQLIDRLFRSLHLATSRVPGSLAVATIITCAIFATATGIVGAVVTLMGLLAFPAMLKAGYNVKVAAGGGTAGGCLGIMLPPSVLLIVYGATAGVSVVQLYAGAFFPGMMLAGIYIVYIIVLAKWKPALMPPLSQSERRVPLPPFAQTLAQRGSNALTGLWRSLTAGSGAGVAQRTVLVQLFVTLLPALFIAAVLGVTWRVATAPEAEVDTAGLVQAGLESADIKEVPTGLAGAPDAADSGAEEPPGEGAKEVAPPSGAEGAAPEGAQEPPGAAKTDEASPAEQAAAAAEAERSPAPTWFWIVFGIGIAVLAVVYWLWNWERLEGFKLLLASFFSLSLLIFSVLGSIV